MLHVLFQASDATLGPELMQKIYLINAEEVGLLCKTEVGDHVLALAGPKALRIYSGFEVSISVEPLSRQHGAVRVMPKKIVLVSVEGLETVAA